MTNEDMLIDAQVKTLSHVYDTLYKRASQVLKMYNPCKIKGGKCVRGDFCCHDCKYLTKEGCSVESLACRTFLCGYVNAGPEALEMKILIDLAMSLGFYDMRESKENTVEFMRRRIKRILTTKERANARLQSETSIHQSV